MSTDRCICLLAPKTVFFATGTIAEQSQRVKMQESNAHGVLSPNVYTPIILRLKEHSRRGGREMERGRGAANVFEFVSPKSMIPQ